MRTLKMVGIGCMAVLAIVAVVFFFKQKSAKSPAPTPPASETPAAVVKTPEKEAPSSSTDAVPAAPATHTPVQVREDLSAVSGPPATEAIAALDEEILEEAIDPVRLAEAELSLINNQLYEEVAQETLPTLSIQTHNPVWVLEDEAAEAVGITEKKKRSGPFGTNIQPNENEIWLRIPPDYADEHREIMAENADLYRAETGADEPITVTLWVGGRPYAKYQYE